MSQALNWDSHRFLHSSLKAARDYQKPPLSFILEDPKHVEWNIWDIKIANAYQMMLDFEVEGWPIWVDQSERVVFEVKTRKSRSAAALEKAQFLEQKKAEKAKNYVPKFGQRLYAVPKTVDGGPMPTKKDWVLEQSEKVKTERVADPGMVSKFRERHMNRKRRSE